MLTNGPGEDAYPITATTFVPMPKAPKSPERSAAAIDFVRWSLDNGKSEAQTLNYVPLPPALIDQIESYWQQSIDAFPKIRHRPPANAEPRRPSSQSRLALRTPIPIDSRPIFSIIAEI